MNKSIWPSLSAAQQRGFLLVGAVVMIVVMALLAVVLTFLYTGNITAAAGYLRAKQAFFIAESGLERGGRALLAPSLTERIACNAITANPAVTNIAFGQGLFTLTSAAPFYPPAATTTSVAINTTDTVIPVNSTVGYAPFGRILIDREVINYLELSNDPGVCGTAPCFAGVQRAQDGSLAAIHTVATPVGQYQCTLDSQGGVPNFVSTSERRFLTVGVQLQEAWITGDRVGNNFTFLRWNRPTEGQWINASFPDGPNRENLNDLSLLNYAEGWAVGNLRGNNFTLVRLTPGGWVAQPLNDNANRQNLNGVYCVASNDCWAVGNRNGNNFTFVRRTGAGWVAQPLNDNANREDLNEVYCVASNDCWAVGNRNGNNFTFVRRTGAGWVAQPLNDNANRENLNSVYCVSSNDCWAVGNLRGNNFTFVRRTGAGWAAQPLTSAAFRQNLHSVYCPTTNDCWAVGDRNGAGTNQWTLLRWNGVTWARVVVNTPGVGAQHLYSVACYHSNDCWAVGNSGRILHWDGSAWVNITVPGVGQTLRAVDVVGARTVPQAAWQEVFP